MRCALVLAVILAAGPAAAAEKAGDPGTNVEMPFLIAPMSKDGKLLGYSYISSKLVAASRSAALEIRDKVAFIQDAFVRDVNAAPISTAADPMVVDRNLLASRLVADARRIVGGPKVVRIIFGDGDGDTDPGITFSPLHPNQTPRPAAQAPAAPPPAPPSH